MLPGKTYSGFEYLSMAWRRRWAIVIPMFLCTYAALIVSSRVRDMYKSETLIQVVPQRVPNSYVQSTVTMRTEDRLNALTQQVLSRTALESLITTMTLYPAERKRLPLQDVVDLMREDISVEVVTSKSQTQRDQAEAFYVRFSYPDRELATKVTERLGGLFIDMNAKDRGDLAQATDQFLQSQLAGTRRALELQERKLEQFRERNSGRLPTQLTYNMQAIQSSQLAVQALVESLARDRDRKLMLERLYNDAQSEPAATPIAPIPTAQSADPSSPTTLTTDQQLAAAREGLARLELRLKPEHPDITRTKRLISELEKRVAEEATVAKSAVPVSKPIVVSPEQIARAERARQMRAEIESLDRQIQFKEVEEQRQRGQLAEYQKRIEEVPSVESEWTALTRDYDTQAAAYKDLLMKSEQSKVAVELERRQIGEQFKILDPATPPVRPTGIQRLRVNAGGMAVGLMLGLCLAALLEFRDTTFNNNDDVVGVLRLPVLAVVPELVNAGQRRREWQRTIAMSAAGVCVVAAAAYGGWLMALWKFVK